MLAALMVLAIWTALSSLYALMSRKTKTAKTKTSSNWLSRRITKNTLPSWRLYRLLLQSTRQVVIIHPRALPAICRHRCNDKGAACCSDQDKRSLPPKLLMCFIPMATCLLSRRLVRTGQSCSRLCWAICSSVMFSGLAHRNELIFQKEGKFKRINPAFVMNAAAQEELSKVRKPPLIIT